jgi:hypothetical protein
VCAARAASAFASLVLALCAPVQPQAGALEFRRSAHRPQAAAPLTRTTRRSAMHHPTARATIPRFVCALLAISASPSTPTAGTPLRSLRAEHAEARRPSALEGPLTRVTHRHQLLLCPGHTARTPPWRRSASLLALCLLCGRFHPHSPHSTVQPSLVPVRHRKINLSLSLSF